MTLTVLSVPAPVQSLYLADGYGQHRAYVGLKLFRTLVTSDLGLHERIAQDQTLVFYLIHVNSDEDAQLYRQVLADSFEQLQNAKTRVEVVTLEELLALPGKQIAGAFITQPLNDDELKALVAKSIAEPFVLFSPFEGDVEQGVLGGLSVQATVRPYINLRTLKRSGLNIKSFYMKVAIQYE
ncbi:hypothetical protein [Bowmanella denitrificans]|uniref:hypothetical protein n=1 Tax=Bowmanella denitrificans TaxID=366582 RepID=UPI0011AF0271|nr:hypothetical protein [Bowmanella denitrificans]